MSLRRNLVVIAVIAVGGAAVWALSRPDPVSVVVHSVDKGRVESTVANTRAGTVEACRRAKLSLAVGGQIEQLPIKEGDRVEPGQVLLELSNDDLEAQVLLSEQQKVAAHARAEEACARADVAAHDAVRVKKLNQQNLASEGDKDKAVGEAKASRAACAAARASVGVSEAQLQVAHANLERTILRAPFPGIIAEINGELFEFVTPSPIGVATPPAVDLIDSCCVYVSAPIDEVDAPNIKPDQEARVSLDAFPDKTFPAVVRRVAPYVLDVEKQSRTVDVEVDFRTEGLDVTLMAGYSADVEVLLDAVDNVLRVPTAAVLEGPKVLVFKAADGVIEARSISTGLKNWRWTEVVEGIAAGEQVITSVDREGVVDGATAVAEEAG